jgi:hypothetical protein
MFDPIILEYYLPLAEDLAEPYLLRGPVGHDFTVPCDK